MQKRFYRWHRRTCRTSESIHNYKKRKTNQASHPTQNIAHWGSVISPIAARRDFWPTDASLRGMRFCVALVQSLESAEDMVGGKSGESLTCLFNPRFWVPSHHVGVWLTFISQSPPESSGLDAVNPSQVGLSRVGIERNAFPELLILLVVLTLIYVESPFT